MFTKFSQSILTKPQLQNVLRAWEAQVTIPSGSQKEVICFPGTEYVEITRHVKAKDSDYKGALYKLEFFRVTHSSDSH